MSVTSLYGQIADDLRHKIINGELVAGDQVPTERELREQYQVSAAAARQALATLRAQGLIYSVQGKGSFVAERVELFRNVGQRYSRLHKPNLRESQEGGWEAHVSMQYRLVQASEAVAARLRIEPGEMVTEAVYRWTTDGAVTEISTQWEPWSLVKGTSIEKPASGEKSQPDVITRYDSIGIHVDEVVEDIRTRMPTPDEAREMRIPPGVAVFDIQRTHLAHVPVETADIVLRGDKWVIRNSQIVPM